MKQKQLGFDNELFLLQDAFGDRKKQSRNPHKQHLFLNQLWFLK